MTTITQNLTRAARLDRAVGTIEFVARRGGMMVEANYSNISVSGGREIDSSTPGETSAATSISPRPIPVKHGQRAPELSPVPLTDSFDPARGPMLCVVWFIASALIVAGIIAYLMLPTLWRWIGGAW